MEQNNEIIELTNSMEIYPTIMKGDLNLSACTKLPIENLPALGVAFEPIMTAFSSVINRAGESGLYRVTVPNGMHLASASDGSGLIGSALSNTSNQIAGQARLNPVVCNPTMLFMAVALANIQKKLDAIQKTQQEMLDFLVQKQKSDLRGNLLFLTDIMKNFKFNWNNKIYKNSNHIKVLDIRQEAEKSIIFSRTMIEKAISKKTLFHGDQDVNKLIEKVRNDFEDYQMAVYLFAYASFLEVMLLGNYDAEYLSGISSKIEDYSFHYRDLYTKSYDQIEKQARTSVQSILKDGVAGASSAIGGVLSKVPVLNKSPLDEILIGSGKSIKESGNRKNDTILQQLVDKQSSDVRPFIDNINMLNQIYGKPLEVVFDRNNLYILDKAG